MRKPLLLAGIIAWSLVLVIIVAIVAVNLRGGGWQGDGNATLLKEEQLDLAAGARLVVQADSLDIEFLAGVSRQLRVRQYGTDERRLFSVRTDAGGVTVQLKQRARFGFNLPRQERLEIELPQGWLGDVQAEVSSGRLRINDAFTWQDVFLSSSSGSIAIEQGLTAASLNLDSNSGNIRVLAELNISGECNVSASSGSVHLKQDLSARKLFGHTNSGDIRLATATVEEFDLRSSSGSIRATGLSGSGSARANSGSIDIALQQPLGDISLQASSGVINIKAPADLAFSFQGQCSSGSIKTDFPVDERDKGKYVSGSVGANPAVSIDAEVNSGSIHISR